MLEYLLLLLAALALGHFIIDGILAPDHQLLTRLKVAETGRMLDALRDRKAKDLDAKAVHALRSTLENLVRHPTVYTLWTVCQVKRQIETDGALQRQLAQRAELMSSIKDPELQQLRDRVPVLAAAMLTCNSAGWMLFILPIALALLMYHSTLRTIKAIINLPEPLMKAVDRGPQTTLDRYFR